MPRMRVERPARGALETAAAACRLQLLLDQVRDDLGVGLGDELVPLALQLALQLEVVLDDAVVHDDDAAGAVAVRVGVLLGRPAVRGPAGVPDAVFAVERVGLDRPPRDWRACPALRRRLMSPFLHDRDARRVVAAVFEPPQAVDQDGNDGLGADVADDAAHGCLMAPGLRWQCSGQLWSVAALAFGALGRSRFFNVAQPSLFSCRPRAMPSAPAGTSLVIVDPAAT